jgi:hypothetical protein
VSKLTFAKLWARSYATWQAPGSTEIRISSLVVDGISTEVMKGLDAIPPSGHRTEVGGILLGRSGKDEIVVDDFEAVLCEHSFGPSFRLSDSDRSTWQETVQRIRQRGEFAVVGWYRTDTREEFALSEDDRELLETELHQDGGVILLIKPTQSQPCEAKVFIRDDEQLREVPQATYFAFDRRASSSAEPLVKAEPTGRTETPFSGIEQLWNPTKVSEFFDSGNDTTSREVASSASVERDGHQPKEFAPTPSDERKLEYSPATQPGEGEKPTASVPREGEPVCFADPPLLAGKAESRPEFEPTGPLALRSFLAQQPLEERKSRKVSFIVGAMLLAAICGTLGYYAVRMRPAAPASRQLVQQAPAPPSTSQMGAALQPAQASAVQTAETKPTVQPPNATENQLLAAETDRQVRLFLLKWADAVKSTNLDDVGDFYAPKMSRYFAKRGVTRASVRAARAHDYARYGRMIVCDIKTISVDLVDSGHAVATFRKRWQTAGPRVWLGEEQEQLTLIRDQGRWQIGEEKRTKLYWMRKEHYDPVSRRRPPAAR